MTEDTKELTKLYSHYGLLCLIGQKVQTLNLLEPLHQLVKIKQKTVKYRPTSKLEDGLIGILCGSEAVYQINTTLKADPAVSLAFGRSGCADQATVQRTLSALDQTNLAQIQQALAQILQRHSQVYRHDFKKEALILDIDMSGLPCSKQYEGAEKGYFAGCKRGTTGRQLLRVSASQYGEIVCEQVLAGNKACRELAVLVTLLNQVWQILGLAARHRSQILLRLDGGFGTAEIVNYLIAEGYQFVVKQYNGLRANKRAGEVAENDWQADGDKGRSWALLKDDGFYQTSEKKLWQIAVRCQNTEPKAKAKGKAKPKPLYSYSILLVWRDDCANLDPSQHLAFATHLHFYDDRACIESESFRGDKQGLKLLKRRKHSLAAQEALVLLSQLAHNLVAWAKHWLGATEPRLLSFGTKRIVRDLLTIPARFTFREGRIVKVRLVKRHALLKRFATAFEVFCHHLDIALIWRET